jgi:hypothetical protein
VAHVRGGHVAHVRGGHVTHVRGGHVTHVRGGHVTHVRGGHVTHVRGGHVAHVTGLARRCRIVTQPPPGHAWACGVRRPTPTTTRMHTARWILTRIATWAAARARALPVPTARTRPRRLRERSRVARGAARHTRHPGRSLPTDTCEQGRRAYAQRAYQPHRVSQPWLLLCSALTPRAGRSARRFGLWLGVGVVVGDGDGQAGQRVGLGVEGWPVLAAELVQGDHYATSATAARPAKRRRAITRGTSGTSE